MNEDFTKLLRAEFPILFGPTAYADYLRGFGFECNAGWIELIRKFGKKCKEHNLLYPDQPIVALIVKEKFGGLRIQGLTNMTEELWSLLREVEEESYYVCEVCGQPGKLLTKNYWWKTRCKEHESC